MKHQILYDDTIQMTHLENMTARIKGGIFFPGFILGSYLNTLTTLELRKYTLSETLCFCFCLFKTEANTQTPLIGWLTHAWPSNSNNNRAAVLNQFSRAKLAVRHSLGKGVTWWRSEISQSHWIKGGTADEALLFSRCRLAFRTFYVQEAKENTDGKSKVTSFTLVKEIIWIFWTQHWALNISWSLTSQGR